jgi:phosphate transport system substrate-binding protein
MENNMTDTGRGYVAHLIVFGFAIAVATPAVAREQIRAVGSSTVYPFITIAAEQFGQDGDFKTPIVESTGTGGGFKLFCEGLGDDKPDISNASRKIMESEIAQCKKNGVTDIAEFAIGYDGIILANKKGAPLLDLSKKEIFMALARELPGADGKMVKNNFRSWKEINKNLPDYPIEIYGPPPTSGTRDAFVELVMEKGCQAFSEFAKAYPDEKARKRACHMIREDGKYVESGEDDNIIVQKLSSNEKTLGILGYSFMEENAGKIQASKIEGVAPNFETIENGQYSVSRSLYIYVKKQHIGKVPGIAQFVREVTSENAAGTDGYMTTKGLLPLNAEERKAAQDAAKKLASE